MRRTLVLRWHIVAAVIVAGAAAVVAWFLTGKWFVAVVASSVALILAIADLVWFWRHGRVL